MQQTRKNLKGLFQQQELFFQQQEIDKFDKEKFTEEGVVAAPGAACLLSLW